MTTFRLKIDSENAALVGPTATMEIERILNKVRGQVATGHESGIIMDVNGNRVGSWDLEVTEDEGDDDE